MRLLAKIGARGLLSAGVAVLGLLGLGGSSVAQTAQPKAQAAPPQAAPVAPPPPNWVVNCQNIKAGLDCRAGPRNQRLLDRSEGGRRFCRLTEAD